MAHLTTQHITNKNEWDTFLLTHVEANFLQSWLWGDFHEALKKKVFRIGIYRDDVLIGLMLLVREVTRRATYLTVPGGPIIDWTDEEVVSCAMNEMRTIAHSSKSSFIRVRPQLVENDTSEHIFKHHGFILAPMHLHAELTSQLSIVPTEDELLKGMRKQTRAEIRKGKTEGIVVESSTDSKDIEAFYEIQCETARRQGFVPFTYTFLHEQFKIFAKAGHAVLYTAKLGEEVLAYAFIIFYNKEAAYHYGASTDAGRKHPGAYMIQWEAICEAKRRGMTTYNFWGVAKTEDKKHRFYPISIFKRGFGGVDFAYLHARDLVIKPLPYGINFIIEYTRKLYRRV
jgi:peptidoglycan pentaglycine glycine transferase (the first glycine)